MGVEFSMNRPHLLLMQKPLFSAAIDQVYKFEQVHLKQREIISGHIAHADPQTLQRWLNSLTQDLLKTNRIAGKLHFELSASVPYDKIVHTTLASLNEKALDAYRPVSDYVLSGVTGVAEGYQQLLKRIDTLRAGFEDHFDHTGPRRFNSGSAESGAAPERR
jgi:hypothetical protein